MDKPLCFYYESMLSEGWDGFHVNTMRPGTGWYSRGSDGLRERKKLMLDHSDDGTAGFRFPC